jgi:hypothetical protein
MHEVLGAVAVEHLECLEEPAYITALQPHALHMHTMPQLVFSDVFRSHPTKPLHIVLQVFLIERHFIKQLAEGMCVCLICPQ